LPRFEAALFAGGAFVACHVCAVIRAGLCGAPTVFAIGKRVQHVLLFRSQRTERFAIDGALAEQIALAVEQADQLVETVVLIAQVRGKIH